MNSRIMTLGTCLTTAAILVACSAPAKVAPDQPFIADIRPMLSSGGVGGFSDDDLIQMDKDTCKQLEAGATADRIMAPVRVADTTVLAAEIGAVIGAAKVYYCPGAKK